MSERLSIIVDHDGGIDDFPAFSLLLVAPDVRVESITVCPADSYKEPAVRATKRFADYLNVDTLSIAAGDFEGINPFPTLWRKDSYRMASLDALDALGEVVSNKVLDTPASDHLIDLLSKREFIVLTTGPLTNLADALRKSPTIKRNVRRLYMMGGAVRTQGNVEHAGHDGTAEWNIFNNPKAAQTVIESGIKITMVPLDATNKVPLTRTFLDSLKAQEKYASSRLLFEAWNLAATYIDQGTYYFWDTLTSASILKPDLIKTERMRIKVVVNGPSQGRMVESSDGHWVDVAVDADRRAVEELFLTMLKK